MDYQSLYRKWRPQTFADGFIGQRHVVRTLRNALLQGKVGHAYLFAGPRGTGKTTAAKVFSKAINCTGRGESAEPCNACLSCQRINAGVSLDVLEIDGASNRGIDEIRDLREKVKFAPAEGRYKIYIIDEVHMLTMEAFNALLKTLEEPPAHVIFIFATTEVQKVPSTILSRCQRFDFKRLSVPEIMERLRTILREEGRESETEALRMIALRADGGMRDAIGLLEQTLAHADGKVSPKDVRDVLGLAEEEQIFALAEAILRRNMVCALQTLEALRTEGKDLYLLTRETACFFRDLLLLALPDEEAGALVRLEGDLRERSKQLALSVPLTRLRHAAEVLFETAQTVRRGAEGLLPLEMSVVRLMTEEDAETAGRIAALEERVERLEKSGIASRKPVESGQPAAKQASAGVHPRPAPGPEQKKTPGIPAGAAELRSYWEEILRILRTKKRTVEALLREGQPGPVRNGRWTIRFAPHLRFHLDSLNQPPVRALVNEIVSQVVGEPIILECVPFEPSAPAQEAPAAPQPEGSDDFLQQSLAILGGEAKKIKEDRNP